MAAVTLSAGTLFSSSRHHQFIPTPATLSISISSATCLSQLKQIHAQILTRHFNCSNSLLSQLLHSSLRFPIGGLSYSLSVFSTLQNPEPQIINRFIRQLSRSRQPKIALSVLESIISKGLVVDRFVFPPLLKAAAKSSSLFEGKTIQGLALKLGFITDPYIQTALMGMYASCKQILEARTLFDKMSHRDIVAWTIMIDGYCQEGLLDDVLLLVEEMKDSNVELDGRVFPTIFSACAKTSSLEIGKAFHKLLMDNDIEIDYYIQSSLVNMYASCGSMDVAQRLYDELPDKSVVASTALVCGYSKLGLIEDALSIFNRMEEKDLICWSSMISGYAKSDQPQEALKLFDKMQGFGLTPDQVTMLSIISACAKLGVLDQAKQIHRYVVDNGFGENLRVNNALIDMYDKCGSLGRAKKVFCQMRSKNVISWTSMINAFAKHKHATDALKLFYQMKEEDIQPNWVTFVGILYACSHAGLVEEGKELFNSMMNEYKITPRLEHYGCMVDLYGRANLLREAHEVVKTMPFSPSVIIWGSLMDACWTHGELELGEFAAKQILEMDPNHDRVKEFLSSINRKS